MKLQTQFTIPNKELHDLAYGNKVKVSMRFRGREMEHQNLGLTLLKRLEDEISSIGMGDQTYNPGISALSLDFNRMTIIKDQDNNLYPSSHPLSNIIIKKTNLHKNLVEHQKLKTLIIIIFIHLSF